MTEPTDEALENLFVEETGFDIDDFPAAILDFARAVLAKWGQPAQAEDSVGRDAGRVEKWSGRIQRAHPKSEPEFWPDALRVKYMADEISDLRAARAPADSVTAPAGGVVAAHRVMRKRLDGEWVCDGRYWCDGPPSKELVESICADKDRWRVDVAYTTPPAQAADSVLEDAERYRNAIASACEGWTMPDGLRKHLETALWSPPTTQPTQAQAVAGPLSYEQIQDLLLCGDPTDEEMRLIRIGWDAAHASKGGQHGTE